MIKLIVAGRYKECFLKKDKTTRTLSFCSYLYYAVHLTNGHIHNEKSFAYLDSSGIGYFYKSKQIQCGSDDEWLEIVNSIKMKEYFE